MLNRLTHLLFVSIATLGFTLLASANDTCMVRLVGLLPGSRVYVDGRPQLIQDGAIEVSAGEHLLQVEAFQTPPDPQPQPAPQYRDDVVCETVRLTGVVVFRTCVAVTQPHMTVAVKTVPVFPTNAGYAPYAGVAPPMGDAGPAGRPGRPADLHRRPNFEEARRLLLESAPLLFAELERLCVDIEANHLAYQQKRSPVTVLWYSPHEESARTIVPKGPWADLGNHGPQGMPGDVTRLRDEAGQSFLDRITKEWKLNELRQRLTDLEQRSKRLPIPWHLAARRDAIQLYTPSLRTILETAYTEAAGKEPAYVILGPEPSYDVTGPRIPKGPVGLPGITGPVGSASTAEDPNAHNVSFNKVEVEKLLTILQKEPGLQNRLQALHKRLRILTEKTRDAETQVALEPQCLPLKPDRIP